MEIRGVLDLPVLYSLWQLPFNRQKVKPFLDAWDGTPCRVLDIGCGPGINRNIFKECDYTGIDINPRFIEAAKRRAPGCYVAADAVGYDFSTLGMFDLIFIDSFLHHLSDLDVEQVLGKAHVAMAPGGRVHILELLLPSERNLAGWLARMDRGEYPRPVDNWSSLFSRYFRAEAQQKYYVGFGGLPLWHMYYWQGCST